MKNKLYLLGIILVILFALGAIFKINHWPGASIALVLSLSLFSFVFTPLALINCYKTEKKHAFVYLAGAITIIFNFVGAMFKINHWPGASILLTIAIVIPFVLFLPAYLVYLNKSGEKQLKNLISVLFLLAYIGAMNAILALNVSKVVLNDSTLINDHYSLLSAYYEQSSKSDLSNADSSQLKELNILLDNTDKLISQIADLKKEMALVAAGNNEEDIKRAEEMNIWYVYRKDNMHIPGTILVNEGKATDLKSSINEYKKFLLEFSDGENAELVNKYINTDDIEWEGNYYSWEEIHFSGTMLIWALNHLTSVEFHVRMVENEIIESITNS
jgi:hypothetical protein